MPVVDVMNLEGKTVGQVELADDVFGAQVNKNLLHESVRHHLAGKRAGTHKTKDKSEVSGAGRKLWRQKGTGRARIGSIRSPLWRHGGTVHGPVPRKYDYALPKKMVVGALRSALSAKLAQQKLTVVEGLEARLAQDEAVPRDAFEARQRDAHDPAGRDGREREPRTRQPQHRRRDTGAGNGARDVRPDAARPADAVARGGAAIEPRAFGDEAGGSRDGRGCCAAPAKKRSRRAGRRLRRKAAAKKAAPPKAAKKPRGEEAAKGKGEAQGEKGIGHATTRSIR